ncbi:MAG: hypothetical protein M3R24_34550 [Chloroflexota bacterium]|nr:hypothetical protein [Chloroflexota bacterium]
MAQNILQPNMTNDEDAPLLEREVNSPAIALLRQWREEGDEVEQRETFEDVATTLDEDRPSNRPLF